MLPAPPRESEATQQRRLRESEEAVRHREQAVRGPLIRLEEIDAIVRAMQSGRRESE